MGQQSSKDIVVNGTVSKGYESVKEMFTENFRIGREDSAQLCVYVGEEKVVDLWASASVPTYNADTLTNVFSSGKSLTAIAMALMQDRGLLKYDSKIADYWPEFAQNGKQDVTVADLMRHEAGLAGWDTALDVTDALTENIKKNSIGKIIEKQQLRYPDWGKREYHAITRGWVANEIFRRVHPDRSTLGEFLQKEISTPLNADVFIGVDKPNVNNYAPVADMKFSFVLGQSMIPESLGRAVDVGTFELLGFLNAMRKMWKKVEGVEQPFADHNGLAFEKSLSDFFNQEIVRSGETSSAGANCTARGLAVIAAAMANKGRFQGKEILSPSGWDAFHSDPTVDFLFANFPGNFTQGGVAKFEEPDRAGRDGYYGWFGYGGSIFQWHPGYKIGFAYTPTLMEWYSIDNGKGKRLQREVVKCIENMQ